MIVKKLAGQTLIYGLSTVIPKVINYFLTPYLTYIAMSEKEFGEISYFYAIIPFAFSILLLGMENGFFRFMGKSENEEDRYKVFRTIWSSTITLAALFFATVSVFQRNILNLLDGDFNPSIVLIVAGIIVVDVISTIPFARLREGEKAIKYSLIKCVAVITNVILVVFFYSALPSLKDNSLISWMWVENFDIGYFMVANLVSSLIAFGVVCRTIEKFSFGIDVPLLKKILKFSIPLFIGGLAGVANDYLDRFFIQGLLPKEIKYSELGIYGATLKITAIMVIFTQMYRFAAEPIFLAKLKTEDFKENNAIALNFFVIVTILIFLATTLYIDIFELLIAPEFRESINLVPILLISSAFSGILLNLSFWYKFAEKTNFAIIINSVGLTASVALNITLIPRIGVEGAAIAKLTSAVFMVIISFYFNQKYYPIPYKIGKMIGYMIVGAIIYFAGQYINIDNYILSFIAKGLLILIFIVYVAIKENLISLILKRKR